MSLRDLKNEETISFHWPGVEPFQSEGVSSTKPTNRSQISNCGIAANTAVETLRGTVAARDLRRGDLILMRNGGYAVLHWIGFSRVADDPEHAPIRFNGNGALLAQDANVLVETPRNELYFGSQRVLAPARLLAEVGLARVDEDVNPLLVHLLFDQVVHFRCGDHWVESLMPDVKRIRDANAEAAKELVSIFPRLSSEGGAASYQRDLLVLNRREVHALLG